MPLGVKAAQNSVGDVVNWFFGSELQQGDHVTIGDFKLQVVGLDEQPAYILDEAGVTCQEQAEKTFESREYKRLFVETKTSLLSSISSEAEGSVGLDIKAARIAAAIKAHLDAQRTISRGASEEIVTQKTTSFSLTPLKCFDYNVRFVQRKKDIILDGIQDKWFIAGGDERTGPIKISLRSEPQTQIRAYFTERCQPEICKISTESAVEGARGSELPRVMATSVGRKQLWTIIRGKQTEFYVPLYWAEGIDESRVAEGFWAELKQDILVHAEFATFDRVGGPGLYVVLKNANLRDRPSTTDGNVIDVVPGGSNVRVIEASDDGRWAKVKVNESTGWIFGELLGFGRQVEPAG